MLRGVARSVRLSLCVLLRVLGDRCILQMRVWHRGNIRGKHAPGGRVAAAVGSGNSFTTFVWGNPRFGKQAIRSCRRGCWQRCLRRGATGQPPGASVTCQVCACVVVSLLLLGCGLGVARPDCHVAACVVVSVFVLLLRPSSGHDRVVAKEQPGPCAGVWRKGDVADVWLCPGRASWAGRRVRAHGVRRVVLHSCCCRGSRLSLQVLFAFAACVVRLLVFLLMACASSFVL